MVLAVVLMALVLFGWPMLVEYVYPTPPAPAQTAGAPSSPAPQPHTNAASPAAEAPNTIRNRDLVLRESPRVAIETPRLKGSINLKGARFDDLVLTTYRETLAKDSPPIRLLSPAGTADGYFASFGWAGDGVAVPGKDTIWAASGTVLALNKPVILSWTNPQGQRFEIKLAIDDGYMFTVDQSVTNGAGTPIAIRPYGLVSRVGVSKDPDTHTIHSGPMGVFNGTANYSIDFKTLDKAGAAGTRIATTGGWLGFTDKYWLAALVPNQALPVDASFRAGPNKSYQADFTSAPSVVAPGATAQASSRFFAGAKEVNLLDRYENKANVPLFSKAIDWGWFEVLEKPIFKVLDWLFRAVGNFGVAIILLTLLVRGLMFPIAQRQFASMAAMRAVQPKMKALQERHKGDKAKLQQEIMALYKTEKVNPLSGCLPIFLQIPIFYALYKVLMLTIEMRHQPFIWWIKDLSAPDPMTPVNLFGLLHFTPPGFLAIGVLPILLGVTMYFQFKLNPQPMDDIQKQVFSIMPWIFMFIMAPFAAGLQLYWATTNILTILQQKWLYSKHPALTQQVAKK
jgi:YidC/Oxa1 family membrane protein insertase